MTSCMYSMSMPCSRRNSCNISTLVLEMFSVASLGMFIYSYGGGQSMLFSTATLSSLGNTGPAACSLLLPIQNFVQLNFFNRLGLVWVSSFPPPVLAGHVPNMGSPCVLPTHTSPASGSPACLTCRSLPR